MKVKVFYFRSFPNHGLAWQRVKQILKEEGVEADVVAINVLDVASALALRFLGSLTIQIDGLDVEPSARSSHHFGMTCRTYLDNGRRQGLPSCDAIRAAVGEAQVRNSNERTVRVMQKAPTQCFIRASASSRALDLDLEDHILPAVETGAVYILTGIVKRVTGNAH